MQPFREIRQKRDIVLLIKTTARYAVALYYVLDFALLHALQSI